MGLASACKLSRANPRSLEHILPSIDNLPPLISFDPACGRCPGSVTRPAQGISTELELAWDRRLLSLLNIQQYPVWRADGGQWSPDRPGQDFRPANLRLCQHCCLSAAAEGGLWSGKEHAVQSTKSCRRAVTSSKLASLVSTQMWCGTCEWFVPQWATSRVGLLLLADARAPHTLSAS